MGVTADDLLTLVPLLYAVPALFIYTAIILGILRLEGTFYRLLAINGVYVSHLCLIGNIYKNGPFYVKSWYDRSAV